MKLPSFVPQLAGVDLVKVAKRLLKRPVLWLLNALEDDVEQNWERRQGPPR